MRRTLDELQIQHTCTKGKLSMACRKALLTHHPDGGINMVSTGFELTVPWRQSRDGLTAK
ncbi:Diphthamide biosynthesis protein 4 [Frankliniella fusca]|uniref:Diphthamide biosynthesis protein 4 n=1 Tax=Frankliniella fusca TaxID=407009 RepID=A0AAE1L6U6_9NEOP|nr:Diphthamide biosynthesis protein 4 [Frankliniella fusca]